RNSARTASRSHAVAYAYRHGDSCRYTRTHGNTPLNLANWRSAGAANARNESRHGIGNGVYIQ
ncbi:MAG: hypothetical protein J4O02_05910, partial [Chloroflexi bacterium]|nr:hypothetical protein [Chloroflexota bacterium]